MKTPARSLVLLAALRAATAPALPASANILSDIHRSISSLWGQKEQQQAGARATLQQADFIEDRLKNTAVLLDRASDNYRNYSEHSSGFGMRYHPILHRENAL